MFTDRGDGCVTEGRAANGCELGFLQQTQVQAGEPHVRPGDARRSASLHSKQSKAPPRYCIGRFPLLFPLKTAHHCSPLPKQAKILKLLRAGGLAYNDGQYCPVGWPVPSPVPTTTIKRKNDGEERHQRSAESTNEAQRDFSVRTLTKNAAKRT